MSILLRCHECGHKCEVPQAVGPRDKPLCPQCLRRMVQTAANSGDREPKKERP
jgi:predicted nucleic acid-binding Zn ribbon protein